jgi:hypothetical protein
LALGYLIVRKLEHHPLPPQSKSHFSCLAVTRMLTGSILFDVLLGPSHLKTFLLMHPAPPPFQVMIKSISTLKKAAR